MNKLVKYGVLAGTAMSLLPIAARAEEDIMSVPDATSTASDAAAGAATAAAAGGLFAGLAVFWLIFVVVGIALLIFWIFMLMDVFKRTNWKQESDKNLWLIILLVGLIVGLGPLAAIVYYFAVKRPLDSASKPAAPKATTK